MRKAITPSADQVQKFHRYQSLDLTNKVYQKKALRLAKKFCQANQPFIVELASADDSFTKLISEQLRGTGRGLDITKGDDFSKPLAVKSGVADLVIALEIIEHLYDTDFFMSEIHRILKPGGLLILSTPNLASLGNRLKLLFGGYPHYLEYSLMGAGHIHLYTLPVLKSQLHSTDFRLRATVSPNFPCPFITKKWFPEILKEFCMFLGDLLPQFGSHLLVVAEKK
jgi:SAM-dependent methyltransferase